ncbi:MAG TPA: hypothetical protein VGK38_09970 [Prolixibacteraceae bacterium]|jgi:hypothetical protein
MSNILEQAKSIEIKTNSSEWITLKELAAETGICEPSLRSLCLKGILPHQQAQNNIINVSRTEYNEWMSGNRIKTAKEIQAKAMAYNSDLYIMN